MKPFQCCLCCWLFGELRYLWRRLVGHFSEVYQEIDQGEAALLIMRNNVDLIEK